MFINLYYSSLIFGEWNSISIRYRHAHISYMLRKNHTIFYVISYCVIKKLIIGPALLVRVRSQNPIISSTATSYHKSLKISKTRNYSSPSRSIVVGRPRWTTDLKTIPACLLFSSINFLCIVCSMVVPLFALESFLLSRAIPNEDVMRSCLKTYIYMYVTRQRLDGTTGILDVS